MGNVGKSILLYSLCPLLNRCGTLKNSWKNKASSPIVLVQWKPCISIWWFGIFSTIALISLLWVEKILLFQLKKPFKDPFDWFKRQLKTHLVKSWQFGDAWLLQESDTKVKWASKQSTGTSFSPQREETLFDFLQQLCSSLFLQTWTPQFCLHWVKNVCSLTEAKIFLLFCVLGCKTAKKLFDCTSKNANYSTTVVIPGLLALF